MHEELKLKANSRSNLGTPTEQATESKAQERKKIVQDLVKKSEPCSASIKLNEQRRMEFFAQDSPTCIVENSNEVVESDVNLLDEEKVGKGESSLKVSNSIEEKPSPKEEKS